CSHGYVYLLVSASCRRATATCWGWRWATLGSDRGIVTFRPNPWRRPCADRRVVERGGTSLFGETGVRLTDWRKLERMIEEDDREGVQRPGGALRHRSDVGEDRAEQHATKLGDRLTAVRGGETLPRTLADPAAPAG